MYVNVGARSNLTNLDIPTKADLKRQLGDKPALVTFYSTDAIGEGRDKLWFGDSLDIGTKYTVTGPNPYTNRKWYATVEKAPNGKITVK